MPLQCSCSWIVIIFCQVIQYIIPYATFRILSPPKFSNTKTMLNYGSVNGNRRPIYCNNHCSKNEESLNGNLHFMSSEYSDIKRIWCNGYMTENYKTTIATLMPNLRKILLKFLHFVASCRFDFTLARPLMFDKPSLSP